MARPQRTTPVDTAGRPRPDDLAPGQVRSMSDRSVTPPTRAEQRIRDEGRTAYAQGMAPEACPYRPGGWQHTAWQDGFAQGRAAAYRGPVA